MDLKTKSMREAKKFFEDFQGVELTGIIFHSHEKVLEASQSDLWDLMDSYHQYLIEKHKCPCVICGQDPCKCNEPLIWIG